MKLSEKLKSINKKVYIFGGIGLVLLAAVVVALVIGLSGNKAASEPADADDTTTQAAQDTSVDSGDDTTEADETDDTADTTDTAEVTGDVTEPDESTADDSTSDQPQDTEPPVTNVNPNGVEITGAGSESQPYLEIPADDMTVTTVEVPAGAELYYDIYRVGGMFLTVNDPDAYVICDNLLYEAYNGAVYFQVPNALASDTVSFRIGNYSGTAKSFKLIFTSAEGSYANPVVIDTFIDNGFNVELAEGDEDGFYLKHYAQQSGVIRFYMQASEESVFIVTNNRNSAQRTSDADAQTDADGNEYIEIEVNQGDELLINVGALPNKRGKYPAVMIWWNGFYN